MDGRIVGLTAVSHSWVNSLSVCLVGGSGYVGDVMHETMQNTDHVGLVYAR